MNKYKKGIERRSIKIRAKISGSTDRPRLVVTRSSKFIYAQIIDDITGKTLLSGSDRNQNKENAKITKSEKARSLGKEIAEKAKKMKIGKIVFDRNGYKYHGRIKALADGAREGGLLF
jgi:large subunit ribosomal protein L18